MKVRIKVPKIGMGTEEDPYRPALVTHDGREFGRHLPGITWTAIEVTEHYYVIEVGESELDRLKREGVRFERVA